MISLKEEAPIHTIGRVTDDNKLIINDSIDLERHDLHDAYFNSLERIVNE